MPKRHIHVRRLARCGGTVHEPVWPELASILAPNVPVKVHHRNASLDDCSLWDVEASELDVCQGFAHHK
jgi:hypothetical protein